LLNESPDKFDGLLSVLPSIWASVDIEGVFKESNIFTMASGNTGDVLKFFLYAEEVNSHALILCKLKINIHLASASINIKTGYLTQDKIIFDAQETELFKYSQRLQNLKNLIMFDSLSL
ncbi:4455_t:CDS:2, partial [Scutellospora calospora]